MEVITDDFTENKYIYNKVCNGKNFTPSVKWKNGPKNTKSYAVVLYDPDSNWIHWIVYNINPNITFLKTDDTNGILLVPKYATVAKNSYNFYGYGGPCPPPGQIHNYNLSVHALNVDKISESFKDSPHDLYEQIINQTISKATFITRYGRRQ